MLAAPDDGDSEVKSRVFTPRAPTVPWGENKQKSSALGQMWGGAGAEGARVAGSRELSLEKTLG